MNLPNPGSQEAFEAGCICPIVDNHFGKGYHNGRKDENGETMFVVNAGCPLHDPPKEQP